MEPHIDLTLPALWMHVREVRRLIDSISTPISAELRSAIGMAAAELVENAIKYGDVDNAPGPHFQMHISDGVVCIKVSNHVASVDRIGALTATIERISSCPDKEALYVARLAESQESCGSPRLGLYRVAYEGGFELSWSQSADTVTVSATRGLQ